MKRKAAGSILVALVFVLALCVLLYFVGMPAFIRSRIQDNMEFPQPVAGEGDYQGAAYCATCHQQQFAEWNESLLAKATTEALFERRVRELSWGMTREQCLTCHAPTSNREEGIGCEACHGPDQTKEVVEDICIRCHGSQLKADIHEAMLSTSAEFLQSTAFREGETCISCHMRDADGNVSHRFEGSRTVPEVYQGTVTIESVEQTQGQLLVTVRNNVLGHYLPTGAPENVIFLEVTGYDDGGEVVYQGEVRFEKEARWFRSMPMMVKSDNRLADGEWREVTFDVPVTLTEAEAVLTIRPILWTGEVVQVVVDEKAVSW